MSAVMDSIVMENKSNHGLCLDANLSNYPKKYWYDFLLQNLTDGNPESPQEKVRK